MRKVLMLIAFSFISFLNGLEAQPYSKGYLDSTKEFLKMWVERQPDFVYTVMDNTTDSTWIDFSIGELNSGSFLSANFPVIKYRNGLAIDSIALNESEKKSVLENLKKSKCFRWTREFFPNSAIVSADHYYGELKSTPPGTRRPGISVISLPLFLKNGSVCLLYNLYYCGPDCGYHSLSLYKFDFDEWQSFGIILGGEF
jgi:hypothetical protein